MTGETDDGTLDDRPARPADGSTNASLLERLHDYRVVDDDDDDPVLVNRDGQPVDTWREGYPYQERMTRPDYERDKRLLQIELLKLQNWVKASGERLVVQERSRQRARCDRPFGRRRRSRQPGAARHPRSAS